MAHGERIEEIALEVAALRLDTEKWHNELTRNLNNLTLKVDIATSQLSESQQHLSRKMETVADFIKAVASLQIDQDVRIRRLESQPPPSL